MSVRRSCATLLSFAMVAGCTAGDEPVPVEQYMAHRRPASGEALPGSEGELAPMTGVLVPQSEVTLVAAGFGRVARIDFQLGDRVEEGNVVAQLDVQGDRTDLEGAVASWKASVAELERLELELRRAKQTRVDVETLQAFVSKAELREERFSEQLAAARRRSARASVRERRSRVNEAELRLGEAALRAPFAAEVSQVFVGTGATLAAGDPVVGLISTTRRVRFAVPEEHGGALHEGAGVEVFFPAEGVELSGSVVSVAPEIEPGGRIIVAEATIHASEDHPASLRVGSVAEVRFSDPR